MPIIRHSGRLIYFAHIPKCAGTAIHRYITSRTGTMAFSNTKFLATAEEFRWTKSSPQHIPIAALDLLFPVGFFDESFALTRHPVDRMAAVFLFQREKEGSIPVELTFEAWLGRLNDHRASNPFVFDNHTRPMGDFVPEEATLFRMEDGLEDLKMWIDQKLDLAPDPAFAQIPRINTRYRRHDGNMPKFEISSEARELIWSLYRDDFERFGYDN